MRVETIGRATLYLADCLDVLPLLDRVDIVLTDPPYGIGYEVRERKNRGTSLDATSAAYITEAKGMIEGDDKPFDASPFLHFPKVAMFGANHFDGLRGHWVVWDKRRESRPDNHSDCEMIGTNIPGADRIHRQKWRGVVREGEENCTNSVKLHPNQKPVALLQYLLEQLGAVPGDMVLDPFMGSGSTGVAALRAEMSFVGVEIDARHFETALDRIHKLYIRELPIPDGFAIR